MSQVGSPRTPGAPTVVPASFRDPAGFVWTEGGAIYRHVGDEHREHYDRLMECGLYDELTRDGLLVPHVETTEVSSPRPGAYKILRPEVVGFISYPYEWSFSQLKDAALLTLDIQKRSMERGMALRDATAYNVQFHGGRPVLIDTLSFGVMPEGRPWIAYRQFCQHFLAPLALMAHVDVRFGSLSRTYMDGVPIDLASKLLPRRTRYNPGMLAHIHTQARMELKHQRAGAPPEVKDRQLSEQSLKGIVWSLERAVKKLEWKLPKTAWRDYYQEAGHYTDAALEHKKELVRAFLKDAGGTTVWDLGGNIGVFSREAAALGRSVVCFDIDPGCVENNYRKVRADNETNVLPLLSDLRNPVPALGWANRERAAFAERGPADVAMALALVHHLAIGNNVPLEMVAEFFAELGNRLIIEFVPKSDPMVQTLLANRDDIFPNYDQAGFEGAFSKHFDVERSEAVKETDRILYLLRKR
jgi:hypothetical protein